MLTPRRLGAEPFSIYSSLDNNDQIGYHTNQYTKAANGTSASTQKTLFVIRFLRW